jgi:hypothetical protein
MLKVCVVVTAGLLAPLFIWLLVPTLLFLAVSAIVALPVAAAVLIRKGGPTPTVSRAAPQRRPSQTSERRLLAAAPR